MKAPQILLGDCRETLKALPDASVHCCVTSPPYFGLRDYGVDGQIGLEQSPAEFVEQLVSVFREVRRVLRDDGTLWLNLGDSYSRNYAKGGSGPSGKNGAYLGDNYGAAVRAGKNKAGMLELPEKNLLGIPWRVAFALQADGWYLRQDIIWHKPNPMPESVRDRCTKAHEYIFLLSKSERYYFDQDAMREPANLTGKGNANGFRGGAYVNNSTFDNSRGGSRTNVGNVGAWKTSGNKARKPSTARGCPEGTGSNVCGSVPWEGSTRNVCGSVPWEGSTRNRRSVWTVSSRPFKGAHFATFPPDLIEPCILAGAPPGGVVLDPFGGSGTTAGVALKHGRRAILCELNPEYAAMIPDRVAAIAGAKAKKARKPRPPANDNGPQLDWVGGLL